MGERRNTRVWKRDRGERREQQERIGVCVWGGGGAGREAE